MHNTGTFAVFAASAKEFADKLMAGVAEGKVSAYPKRSDLPEPAASMQPHEVREALLGYAKIFLGWKEVPDTRPPPEERSKTVAPYLDVYRRALDLLSGK